MSEWIVFSILRSGAAIAIATVFVVIVLKLCRCRSPRIHRIAWLSVLAQGVLWGRVSLDLPILSPEEPMVSSMVSTQEIPVMPELFEPVSFESEIIFPATDVTSPEMTPQPETPCARMSVASLFLGVWALGVIVILAFRSFGLYRLRTQLSRAKPGDEGEMHLLHEKRFRLLLSDNFGPAIFFRTILIPESLWEESSSAIRRGILEHEFSHARHHDGAKSLLVSAIATLHWFNPFAWFAVKKFNEAAEWRCDAEAFGSEKNGLATFAESMLALNRSGAKYLAWVQPYKNHDIKERINRLKEHHLTLKESTMKKISILTLLCALLCFSVVKVQLVAQNPKPETTQTQSKPPEEKTDEKSNVPKIVKMFPENNAKNVDPNISQVYLTFDRPMGTGMAWAQRSDDTALSADAPEKFFWTEDQLTCVGPVQLKPNKTYEILLNMAPFIGFRSTDGIASEYVFYTFTTGDGPVNSEKREELAKNLFVKPDPNNPSAPKTIDIRNKDGKFYLQTLSGEIEAAPLSSVPVPSMDESDYTIQSPAFRDMRKIGASLNALSKEEYQKQEPEFSSRYPTGGVVVLKLTKGFRADDANLRPGDIILGFDGYQLTTTANVQFLTKQSVKKDTVMKLWVLRGGKLYYVDIPLAPTEAKQPADGGFVTGGEPGVSGFTHLVTFKPKGDFHPKNASQFLFPFRGKLTQEGPITGYFRTIIDGDQLIGSLCTGDPEWLKRFIETVPEIEFVKSERLTRETFEAYEKSTNETIPPADDGFVTPQGKFTHLVTYGPKDDFVPKTAMDYLSIINPELWKHPINMGYFRTKIVDGKLIAMNLTSDPEEYRKVVESIPKFQYISTERLTEEMFTAYDKKTQQLSLPPTDGGYATKTGFTHIVVFAPKGDFAPKTVRQLLDSVSFNKMNEYSVQLGYFRTRPVDGKLVGSFLTPNPEEFEKMIASIPNLEFLRSERLTEEKFKEYEILPQLSLPNPAEEKLRNEIQKEEWFQKLNPKQQAYYLKVRGGDFSYVYDPKHYDVGDARDEFEKKWVALLEGPEPGFPGRTQLSTYDEAIMGLALIKSDKAAKLLVKIAAEKVVKDNAHRWFAIQALGELGDASVVPDLIPLLYHYNVDCRWETQISLVRLTGQNFGGDEHAWTAWYNENRPNLGKNLPELDTTPIDWTCGSNDPELKKWADREVQKERDAR